MRLSLRRLQKFAISHHKRKPNVISCASNHQRTLVTRADQQKNDSEVVQDKTFVPPSKVPCKEEVSRLEEFVNTSEKLLVITGAGRKAIVKLIIFPRWTYSAV